MNRKPQLRLDAWDAAATIVIVATAFLYAREIGNDFLWGHDGGNGAPYWNAATNSLRFRVLGQLKDYTGLGPPQPDDFYTHHPLLLHFHLVLARAFGAAEWIGRLVPFFYSVATLVLLYRLGRRLYSPAFALVALVVYALIPLHLIFATMLDQQQGGIFWSLLACERSVRWLVSGRRRGDLTTIVVAGTLALQFSWASYFVLGVTGAIAFGGALFAGAEGKPRRRALRLAVVLFTTALANLAVFFVLIRATKGSLSDMQHALVLRSSEVSGYGDTMLERAFDLYGPLFIGLTGAGFTRLLLRWRAGSWRTRDLVPLSFLLGQVGISLLFRNAGRIHSYWTYYAGIGCALLSAETIMAVLAWLRRRRTSKPAIAILVAAVLALQTSFALAQQDWGLATGHASYAEAFDDQFEVIQLAKWLNVHYGRDVTYTLHSSLNARTEVFSYLDAPHVTTEQIAVEPGRCPTRACVLAVDLRRARDGVTLPLLPGIVESHAASIFGAHLLVVELTAPHEEPHAYHLDIKPAGALYRWFVNGRHGPSAWIPAEGARDLLASSLVELAVPTSIAESSKEGRAVTEHCPKGSILAGITLKKQRGAVVALRGLCALGERREPTAWIGDSSSGEDVEHACPSGEPIVGLHLPSANDLGGVTLDCSRLKEGSYVLACPDKSVAVSLHARRARSLLGIGIGCGER